MFKLEDSRMNIDLMDIAIPMGNISAYGRESISDHIASKKEKDYENFLLLRHMVADVLSEVQVIMLDIELQKNMKGYEYRNCIIQRQILRDLRPEVNLPELG